MRKVLVLEDEDNIRSFVVINLKRAGYDTIEASSGEEALEKLKRNPDVKVALLDVMLPGIDGFEVCRRIRGNNAKIGIIMSVSYTHLFLGNVHQFIHTITFNGCFKGAHLIVKPGALYVGNHIIYNPTYFSIRLDVRQNLNRYTCTHIASSQFRMLSSAISLMVFQ